MIEATIRTERQLQVLRDRAASIRRGDQVALLAPEDPDGQGIAGAVTGRPPWQDIAGTPRGGLCEEATT